LKFYSQEDLSSTLLRNGASKRKRMVKEQEPEVENGKKTRGRKKFVFFFLVLPYLFQKKKKH